MTGTISEIQRFSVHDGPGIRTTVFLKGCPMRCLWCHNPETNAAKPQVQLTARRCVGCGACAAVCKNGCHRLSAEAHVFDSARCTFCGACVAACGAGALSVCGKTMTVDEVLDEVARDTAFYGARGGMTVSGGEPFFQPAFTGALLRGARARGMHTCVQTCGQFAKDCVPVLTQLADGIMWDIKTTDPVLHRRLTGCENAPILANLEVASRTRPDILLRSVIITGLTDTEAHVAALVRLALRNGLDQCPRLLRFHPFGTDKAEGIGWQSREKMGRECIPPEETMTALQAFAETLFAAEKTQSLRTQGKEASSI